ncbi:TadE/TadG family type IV pilus assembly protein [Lentzea nigeriaca]|uniref:TadE/TadG family type IV pilus assembly protein n=1 Tax=Lentzea nigeriaca TaxID=1128665 RepID=UPI001956A999|nr:TadE/TadG family type IV pilus assembly protein [Lentzea nigeriaca]MBM7861662.1 Flp pilus assembly protein TadG [Lentzea nigeriaca]
MTNKARDRGATAVEVALLMPILLLLVMGIIDFGRALNAQVTLTQAAREGVRVAALKQPDPAGRTQTAATGLSGVGVAVTACPSTPTPGSDAQVQATYTFTFVTPIGDLAGMFGGGGYGSPITLSAKGVMPCEG